MSLLSAILPRDDEGVKWAKLQRLFRQMADNAGISYALGFPLTDIKPSDTEGIKWQKLGAWAQLIADNIGGGGVPAGPITTSGLTMNTGKILGRTTAGSGVIEEIGAGAGLLLSAGSLSVAAAQTTITSVVPAGGAALTLQTAQIDASGNFSSVTAIELSGGTNHVRMSTTSEKILFKAEDLFGLMVTGTGVRLGSSQGYALTDGESYSGTVDLTLGRNAEGVAEINNGTPGTYRDLKLRNLDATGGATVAGNITTGAPSGGSAAAWKLGAYSAGAPTIEGKIRVEVGGAAYLIAVEEV